MHIPHIHADPAGIQDVVPSRLTARGPMRGRLRRGAGGKAAQEDQTCYAGEVRFGHVRARRELMNPPPGELRAAAHLGGG